MEPRKILAIVAQDPDGDEDVYQSRSQHGHYGYGSQHGGEGEEDVRGAHDHRVGPTTEIAGQGPEKEAYDQGYDHGHDPHFHRDAAPVYEARKYVPSQGVSPQPVLSGWWLLNPARGPYLHLLYGIVGGQEGGEDGHQDKKGDDDHPGHGHLVMPQAVPNVPPQGGAPVHPFLFQFGLELLHFRAQELGGFLAGEVILGPLPVRHFRPPPVTPPGGCGGRGRRKRCPPGG